jgi:hypothetical protein
MSGYIPKTLRDFIFSSHNNVSSEEAEAKEEDEEKEEEEQTTMADPIPRDDEDEHLPLPLPVSSPATDEENKPKNKKKYVPKMLRKFEFEYQEDQSSQRLMIIEHIENFHGNTFISQEAINHFHGVCNEVCDKYEELQQIDPFCMCIAGGALTTKSLLPEQDIDVFFFGTDGMTRDMIIQTYISNHPNARVEEKPHLYDVIEEGTNTVSFIKKIFPNRVSIIGAFDLASCMLLYAGGMGVITNQLGFYSHAVNANFVSKEWYRVNETYKKRVDKYRERGFHPIFVHSMSFDSYIMRVYDNLAKQQQIDIKCASSKFPKECTTAEMKTVMQMTELADLTEDEEESKTIEA